MTLSFWTAQETEKPAYFKVMEPQDIELERILTPTLPFGNEEIKAGWQEILENGAGGPRLGSRILNTDSGSWLGGGPCRQLLPSGICSRGAPGSHTVPRGCNSGAMRFARGLVGPPCASPFLVKRGVNSYREGGQYPRL